MRLLHVSDLHASSSPPRDQTELVQAALQDIAAQDRDTPIDLVIFSGDLAFDGQESSLQHGRNLVLDPLQDRLPGRPILIVPGNHDVDRARIKRIVEVGLAETLTSREAVIDLLARPDEIAEALERLSAWREFAAEWDPGLTQIFQGQLATAFTQEQGGLSVGVAALNTAWRAQGGDEDRGRLLLGEPQVLGSLQAIDAAEVRIVVMHHPLDWLADFDAVFARAQFEANGVFVLSGHDHSPDPTSETSTRGAALYGRAGCLYASLRYSNSYTLLDLDTDRHEVSATIRRWWPTKREFDIATDLAGGGRVRLDWPHRSAALPSRRAALPDVLSPFVELVQSQSVLDAPSVALARATVGDFLVPPRFRPVPHEGAAEAGLAARSRELVDPLASLESNRVVILAGPQFSGVTGSLLWLLERHFRLRGTHVPAYARIDTRISLGRLRDAIDLSVARAGEHIGSVPVLLAIDDAAPTDSRALARLIRFIRDYPDVLLLLGTHGEAHAPIAEALRDQGITHERAFLAPFGRRELRELVTRTVGSDSKEIVERVLRTIHSQHLPRNPLNIAALVAVLAQEPDLTAINESGLLQRYVHVLLENPTAVDPEGLTMDYRRRELLLEHLAAHLVRVDRTRIDRDAVEQFVLDYFASVGWRPGSAGHLVDSLIRRRVLSEVDGGVGFRYMALLYLFAGKWTLEDGEFRAFVMQRPIEFREVVRHAAGLRRNDRALLAAIHSGATAVLAASGEGADAGQFDLIRDEHGWSQVSDLDEVRARLEAPPKPPSESELDEIYEEVADSPSDDTPSEVVEAAGLPTSEVARIEVSVRLLATVLQNSELVPDVAFKAEVLRTVIHGWSIATVLLAVREDELGVLRQLLEGMLDEADPEKRASLAEHIGRVLAVAVMTLTLYVDVGSPQLQGALDEVLADQSFVADTAHDLFASMLYAMLELPKWADRIAGLLERHGRHPIVREYLRQWALHRYYAGSRLRRAEEGRLEAVLVELLMPSRSATTSVAERATQQAQLLEELRRGRLEHRAMGAPGEDELEVD